MRPDRLLAATKVAMLLTDIGFCSYDDRLLRSVTGNTPTAECETPHYRPANKLVPTGTR